MQCPGAFSGLRDWVLLRSALLAAFCFKKLSTDFSVACSFRQEPKRRPSERTGPGRKSLAVKCPPITSLMYSRHLFSSRSIAGFNRKTRSSLLKSGVFISLCTEADISVIVCAQLSSRFSLIVYIIPFRDAFALFCRFP